MNPLVFCIAKPNVWIQSCQLVHVSVQENMKHERHGEVKQGTSTKRNPPAATVLPDKVSSLFTAFAITDA